jgi:hypothetical protein
LEVPEEAAAPEVPVEVAPEVTPQPAWREPEPVSIGSEFVTPISFAATPELLAEAETADVETQQLVRRLQDLYATIQQPAAEQVQPAVAEPEVVAAPAAAVPSPQTDLGALIGALSRLSMAPQEPEPELTATQQRQTVEAFAKSTARLGEGQPGTAAPAIVEEPAPAPSVAAPAAAPAAAQPQPQQDVWKIFESVKYGDSGFPRAEEEEVVPNPPLLLSLGDRQRFYLSETTEMVTTGKKLDELKLDELVQQLLDNGLWGPLRDFYRKQYGRPLATFGEINGLYQAYQTAVITTTPRKEDLGYMYAYLGLDGSRMIDVNHIYTALVNKAKEFVVDHAEVNIFILPFAEAANKVARLRTNPEYSVYSVCGAVKSKGQLNDRWSSQKHVDVGEAERIYKELAESENTGFAAFDINDNMVGFVHIPNTAAGQPKYIKSLCGALKTYIKPSSQSDSRVQVILGPKIIQDGTARYVAMVVPDNKQSKTSALIRAQVRILEEKDIYYEHYPFVVELLMATALQYNRNADLRLKVPRTYDNLRRVQDDINLRTEQGLTDGNHDDQALLDTRYAALFRQLFGFQRLFGLDHLASGIDVLCFMNPPLLQGTDEDAEDGVMVKLASDELEQAFILLSVAKRMMMGIFFFT